MAGNAPHLYVRSPLDMVLDFHVTFDCPVGRHPRLLDDAETELRVALLSEEWHEYLTAVDDGDVVEIADALGDMVYVIYGTALAHGIDLDAVVQEIHASNMSKLNDDGTVLRREDGKVLKGPNYFRPRIRELLFGRRG